MLQYLKITVAVLAFGLVPFTLQGQANCTLTLKGKVVDAKVGDGLPVAALYLREADAVTTTEDDGTFSFENLCSGIEYHLEVHYLGYQEHHEDLIFFQDTTVVVKLREQEKVLTEISVVGAQVEEHTLEQANRLGAVQLRETRGQALGKMLEGVNGVRSLQSGPSVFKPVIHGLHSNRILIYQNDIRLEGQQWGTEHAPEIDPFQAERVAVLKGAPAVRYGAEAIGGVVVIDPPALPDEAGWDGEVSLQGQDNGRMGTASGQVSRGSSRWEGFGWRLQGTVKRAGDFQAPKYLLPNTGLAEASVSGAMGITKPGWTGEVFASHYTSKMAILRSAHIGNLTDLEAALNADTPFYLQPFTYELDNPRQSITHDLVKVDVELPMTARGGWDIIYGWQRNHRQEYDRRRGDRNDRPAMDMELYTNTLDVHYHHPRHEFWKGTVGFTGLWKVNDNLPGTGVTPLIPAYRAGRGSFFAMEQYITEHWEAEVGVRYDEHFLRVLRFTSRGDLIRPQYNFRNPSATIGGLYKVTPQLSVRSILASAWRPPDVSELYSEGLHHGAASLELGDSTLQSEQAFKWLTTLSWTGKRARLEVDAYWQRINNYIYLQPQGTTILTVRGAFPLFQYTQTDARLVGMDVSGQLAIIPDHLRWSAQYSMIRARDLTQGGYLFLIPADRTLNRLQWTGALGEKVGFRTWVEHVFVARQTRISQDADYSLPPPAYNLFHGGLALESLREGSNWELQLQVQNMANTSYRDYMNRFRYFADELGRSVSLGLNYRF